jgi:hypothetical protein
MKYGKQWVERINSFPTQLQAIAIDYKAWKRIKGASMKCLTGKLHENISLASSIFRQCRWRMPFFQAKMYPNEILLAFIDFNQATVEKILKRIKKRFHIDMRFWLTSNAWMYELYSSVVRKRATVSLPYECPICMEYRSDIVISDCGHMFCAGCTRGLYVSAMEKTADRYENVPLETLIGFIRARFLGHGKIRPVTCPMCRNVDPFRKRPLQTVSER